MSDFTLFLIGGGVFLIVSGAIGFSIIGAQLVGVASRREKKRLAEQGH